MLLITVEVTWPALFYWYYGGFTLIRYDARLQAKSFIKKPSNHCYVKQRSMKNFEIKLIYILGISLAAYFAVSIGISAFVMTRLRLADVEFLIPGSFILVCTTVLWLNLLDHYPIYCRTAGTAIFFLFGFCKTGFASVAYPVLRTGTLWEDPGEQGGAVLFMIIFLSLASQLVGFVAGFVPSALFIRRMVRLHVSIEGCS